MEANPVIGGPRSPALIAAAAPGIRTPSLRLCVPCLFRRRGEEENVSFVKDFQHAADALCCPQSWKKPALLGAGLYIFIIPT